MIKIGIIDYGVGNIRSISNALNSFDCETILSDDKKVILGCDGLILPGVGAYKHGMDKLKSKNLIDVINEYVETSKPFLGICLGMQMLFETSSEFGETNGLGLIEGDVKKLPSQDSIKLPFISWSSIHQNKDLQWDGTILENTKELSDFYHVHSYYADPEKSEHILSYSMYNDFKYCSTVNKNNIFGCQYHPEKSGEEGLKIIKSFIDLA